MWAAESALPQVGPVTSTATTTHTQLTHPPAHPQIAYHSLGVSAARIIVVEQGGEEQHDLSLG